MESKEFRGEQENKIFKIENVQGPKDNEVSFSPERGGIIRSMKLNGKEILFVDEVTFVDAEKNVRGGIPILFPNAGPLTGENNPYLDLKQHGFARLSNQWEIEDSAEGEREGVLVRNVVLVVGVSSQVTDELVSRILNKTVFTLGFAQ